LARHDILSDAGAADLKFLHGKRPVALLNVKSKACAREAVLTTLGSDRGEFRTGTRGKTPSSRSVAAEFTRREAVLATEAPVEIGQIAEADIVGDRTDRDLT
jgi:hypothetical protein